MKSKTKIYLRALISWLFCFGFTNLAYFIFNCQEPFWWIWLVQIIIHFLFFIYSLKLRKILSFFSLILITLVFFLTALLIFLIIILLPYSYYEAWLQLLKAGRAGGIISNIFFWVTVWFLTLFSMLAQKYRISLNVSAFCLVILFEIIVVCQDYLITIIFIIISFLNLGLLFGRVGFQALRKSTSSLALLVIVLIISLLLALPSKPGSGFLAKTTLSLEVKKFIIDSFPEFSNFAQTGGLGYSFNEKLMTEQPILTHLPLFKIKSNQKRIIYLRTEVFDRYLDNSWSKSEQALAEAQTPAIQFLKSNLEEPAIVEVTVLIDYLFFLPHLLSASYVSISNQNFSQIQSGNLNTGFNLTLPLLKYDKILIFSEEQSNWSVNSEVGFLQKQVEKALGFSPEIQPESFKEPPSSNYLEVNLLLSERLKELAQSLGQGKSKPWQVLLNIYNYLKQNYSYSLKTARQSNTADFLETFLFKTRKGYSIHFATAFIILARLNKIPARYAKGFFIYLPNSSEEVVIKGLNAHVWPEIWLEGMGWVCLEACPFIEIFSRDGPRDYKLYNLDNDPLTESQLKAFKSETPKEAKTLANTNLNLFACIFVIICFILVLFLIWLGRIFLVKINLKPIPYKGKLHRAARYYNRIIKLSSKMHLAGPQQLGWLAWAKLLAQKMKSRPKLPLALAFLALKLFFSPRLATKKDLRFLKLVLIFYRNYFKENKI